MNKLEVQQIFFACLFRLTKVYLYHAFDKSMRLIKRNMFASFSS
jgi:hypothetical protein